MDSNKNRILIVGLPKSGTSILAYRVAACFDKTKLFFEPGKEKGLSDGKIHAEIYNSPRKNILSKCLYVPTEEKNITEVSKYYNKKIWIYRDPRDWMISAYLYQWRQLNEQNIEKRIADIKNKEQNPSIISFRSLLNKKFPERVAVNYTRLISELHSLDSNWMKIKYEDFVSNQLEPLNNYLGKTIDPEVEVDEKFKRVARSKTFGSWRDWFNEDDVNYFKELLEPILIALDYDNIDWQLDNNKTIDPETGSEYLLNLYKEKRKT